ncbi:MAG: [protein-PII] uridylyltransferase [Desulfatiglandales bacterium]
MSKTPAPVVQDFLESKEAITRYTLQKESGFATSRKYSALLDRFLHAVFREAAPDDTTRRSFEGRLSLVALGSYGRKEVCLGSDVDLLVLHQGKLSAEMHGVISRLLYTLWDAKLAVGHCVLRVGECAQLAADDFRTLTSLIDGRLLLGSHSLYRRLRRTVWAGIESERRSSILEHFLVAKKSREAKFSRQGYFAEPDLKDGLGGIRDIHFMEWMARLYFRCKRLSQIRDFEAFSHFDLNRLNHSKSFLLKIRNHLHALAGRKEDRLLLSFQQPLALNLGYRDGAHTLAAERFLRRLYMHMNRIRYSADEFHGRALDVIEHRPLEKSRVELSPEFSILNGSLVLKEGTLFEKSPLVILEAFREANRQGLSIGSGLIWEIRRRVAEQGRGIVRLPGAIEIFKDIIQRPENPNILRLALEVGLISLFIPEFKKIRNLALFSYYHEETVDLHSLKTVEVILEISKGRYDDRWPLLRKVFEELENPEFLYLTALLHDIGKGYRGDHAQKGEDVIPRILKRLNITGPALKVIPLLVRHHLLLARVSQRRDLNEEKTSERVAQSVKSPENLRLLFILSVADSLCSGPTSNSDWKLMLLEELFLKAQNILEKGVVATPDATERLAKVRRGIFSRLKPQFLKRKIEALMEQVPTRYLLQTPLEDIDRHFRLALTMNKEKIAWVSEKLEHAPVTRLILRTYDQHGLFSKMVGVFTLNNIEVLSAKIYTLKGGLAFDVYEVANPVDPYRENETWEKIRKEAIEAIEGRLPLDALIGKKHSKALLEKPDFPDRDDMVRIDNTASDFFTIIEISSSDRFGLLYKLGKKLFSLGLNIRLAMVSSEKGQVMTGVFYVSDIGGEKILDPRAIGRIEREILSIMS